MEISIKLMETREQYARICAQIRYEFTSLRKFAFDGLRANCTSAEFGIALDKIAELNTRVTAIVARAEGSLEIGCDITAEISALATAVKEIRRLSSRVIYTKPRHKGKAPA